MIDFKGKSGMMVVRSDKRNTPLLAQLHSWLNEADVSTEVLSFMPKAIPLSRGKVALVSDHHYEELNQFKWYCITTHGIDYAFRRDKSRRQIGMHNQIMSPPTGFIADHKNGDGLNNTDENLRLASDTQNSANQKLRKDSQTGFKGVSIDKRSGIYRARIRVNKQEYHLGSFRSVENAARAYDIAAREHFGEFARVNFPEEDL
jgi:hypothetical protein